LFNQPSQLNTICLDRNITLSKKVTRNKEFYPTHKKTEPSGGDKAKSSDWIKLSYPKYNFKLINFIEQHNISRNLYAETLG